MKPKTFNRSKNLLFACFTVLFILATGCQQHPGPLLAGIEALNMAAVESDLTWGFEKGFIAGNYAYFFTGNLDDTDPQGKIVRVDLNNFTPAGAAVFPKQYPNGHFNSFTDGKNGFFIGQVPTNSEAYKLDLSNFSASGLTVLELYKLNPDLIYGWGVFTDGHYAYFTSGISAPKLWRVDIQNFDLEHIEMVDSIYFGGCVIDHYGYLAPDIFSNPDSTSIARVDLQNFTSSGFTILDLGVGVPTDVNFGWWCNANYYYIAPWNSPNLLRFDTSDFTAKGMTNFNPSSPKHSVGYGYYSAFSDGHYAYLLPQDSSSHDAGSFFGTGLVARVDLTNFTSSGVTWLDLTKIDPNWNNFIDGMADSHYIYLEPGDYTYPGSTGNADVVRISLDYAGWTK